MAQLSMVYFSTYIFYDLILFLSKF